MMGKLLASTNKGIQYYGAWKTALDGKRWYVIYEQFPIGNKPCLFCRSKTRKEAIISLFVERRLEHQGYKLIEKGSSFEIVAA